MQITHEQARRLIQYQADANLNSGEQRILTAHLDDCSDCSAYAVELHDMESTLRQVMHRQWDLHPLPLSVDTIKARIASRKNTSMIFAMRTSLISIAFAAFVFVAWQFGQSNNISPTQALEILPVPTPSTQFITASAVSRTCTYKKYIVRENDTLESIARQFSISKEELLIFNNMTSYDLPTRTEINIPLCNFTPTIHAPTSTTTLTPQIDITVHAPG